MAKLTSSLPSQGLREFMVILSYTLGQDLGRWVHRLLQRRLKSESSEALGLDLELLLQ